MKKKNGRRLVLWVLTVFLLSVFLPGCGAGTAQDKETSSLSEAAPETARPGDGDTEKADAASGETEEIEETSAEFAETEDASAETGSGEETAPAKEDGKPEETETARISGEKLPEEGSYTSRDEVALYLYTYGHLPDNFITKNEAKKLGWDNAKGNLAEVAPGKSIGGDRFGNYEGLLPEEDGRKWTECDIGYEEGYRNGERIVFSNDGLIYYTGDHYKSFEQLY